MIYGRIPYVDLEDSPWRQTRATSDLVRSA